MQTGWLGIPWYVYALVCLAVAIGYSIFSIEPIEGYRWADQPFWKFVVLRWFHSLVWVLLCLACLIMQLHGDQGIPWAKFISLTGLLCYLTYLVVLFVEKSQTPS